MSRTSTWEIELPPNIDSLGQEHLNKVCSCRRRVFTTDEDKLLAELVTSKECSNWFEVAQKIPGRTPRQCRDRWTNYLSPTNSFEPWTLEEDQKVIDRVNELGTRWSMISKLIPGRSDNCIKNRWYSCLKAQCALDAHGKYYLRPLAKAQKKASTSLSSDSTKNSNQKQHDKALSIAPASDSNTLNSNETIQNLKKPQANIMNQEPKSCKPENPNPSLIQHQQTLIQSQPIIQPQPQTLIQPQPQTLIQPQPQTLIQSQPQTLIQPQPQTLIQSQLQTTNQQSPFFLQQMVQQPYLQYQLKMQQQIQLQQQLQHQPISFFVPEYDQTDFKPSFEESQTNEDLEAEADDFWDKQLYKQIIGISQDPFNATPDLFGEWF